MNRLRSSHLLTFIVAAGMIACTDDEATNSEQTLVVESYLYVGHPFKVVVSNLVGTSPTDIDHFSLSVSHDGEIVYLNPAGDGTYTSNDDGIVKDNEGDYNLKFSNGDTEISSLAVVPSKPVDFSLSVTELSIEPRSVTFPGNGPGNFIDNSVELTWSNTNNEYYFPFFENIEDDPELINTRVDTVGNRPMAFFRGEPTQESSSQIRQGQFEYYGRYNVILFHVNADYAALYKEQDNSSSLNLQPPFTNVVNGMGIFTAIHSDTIVLTIKKP